MWWWWWFCFGSTLIRARSSLTRGRPSLRQHLDLAFDAAVSVFGYPSQSVGTLTMDHFPATDSTLCSAGKRLFLNVSAPRLRETVFCRPNNHSFTMRPKRRVLIG